MHPEIRAIADRFMYETATLKHITALAPEESLDRPVAHPTLGDVRMQFQHLALALEGFADEWAGWLRTSGFRLGWRPCDLAAKAWIASRPRLKPDGPALREEFGRGLNSLIAALSSTPEGREEEETGGGELGIEVLRVLNEHALSHAIALMDALPEARMDPLVLNWLLYAEFEDEASKAWQAKLLADAREYLANQPHEEEDEE